MLQLAKLIWDHPANRGRRARAIARAATWQAYKRLIGRPFDLRAFRFRFRCYPDSHDASRMIYFNGLPDPDEMEFCRRYLRKGDSVIDAGANVGVYTLFFASLVGRAGSVLAFEPDPTNCDRLRENIDRNRISTATVRQAALADFKGEADFTQGADTGNTLYSLKTYNRPPQTVEVTTLDAEVSRPYALCKMDIEGAEWAALKGFAVNLAEANPPVIIMELSEKSQGRSGASVGDVQEWLAEHGYDIWRYHGRKLIPFVSQARKPGHVGDGIAIHREHLQTVRNRLA